MKSENIIPLPIPRTDLRLLGNNPSLVATVYGRHQGTYALTRSRNGVRGE